VALLHDVLVTAGVFVVCGRQMSLTTVAALLTIVGYSVNDTIVLFDRIREDLKLIKGKPFKDLCNMAINQTLSRTILTTLVTMITVVMLLLFGGGSINDFALALFIGMVAGTYSTIFIATPVVLVWYRNRTPDFTAR
jgi:preprotein translocase SecF subunit